MSELIAVKSEADRLYTIGYLRKKARRTALEAARAAPTLATQLKSLAALLETQAEQLEKHIAELGDCASPA